MTLDIDRIEPLSRFKMFGHHVVRIIGPLEGENSWDYMPSTRWMTPLPTAGEGSPNCEHAFVRDSITGNFRCKRCERVEIT